MATEYKRALASVEALEALVADLAAVAAAFSSAPAVASSRTRFADTLAIAASQDVELEEACRTFAFSPPPRKEPNVADGGWLLIDERIDILDCYDQCEAVLCEEWRQQFWEVVRLLRELEPSAAKMRKKCQARAELEVLRAQLSEILGGNIAAEVDPLQVARSLVEAGSQDADALQPLIDRLRELDSTVIYGSKMNEQVLDLLARFFAAQALFNTDVLPNLGAAVAAADEEARRKREEEEAVAKAEAERLAALEAQRPVLELLEATARAMQEQQLREQAAREAAEHTAALVAEAAIVESYMGCGQLEASLGDEDDRARREGGKQMRSLVPSIGMRLFS
eukprot:TRINITY_DN29943_c0_g1_i2.p1 TRINITY_DN29943_c0_g1~~TRINITY_DN29943_c0_g1_i2.p1  ORF type:complete len:338 (-),score=123.45 TRINITY_DN29943_c0_g1_i2:396-1409(-)